MFKVQVLGISSATPAFSRNPSAQVVNFNERYFLVDCGEGTQMQLQKYRVKFSRLDAIFISHLHGDHILGIPGLLASMSIFERKRPLPLFAPAGLRELIEVLFKHSETFLKYELDFRALEDYAPGEKIFETERFYVQSIPLRHRTFCRGFIFKEQNKRRKFDFYKAKSLEIPNEYFHLLKQENNVTLPDGRTIKADDVLLSPDAPLSYAYCSDTSYFEELVPYIEDVDLLYHEATFMEPMKDRATETQHSTAKEAATIAKMAKAKKLVIGHFSARYKDLTPLLMEAREVFPNTELALEGRVFDLRQNV